MILAGGRGRRIDIFCQHRAKPALFFGGIARVIDFTLSNCVRSMVGNIAVLTDYQRDSMASYVNKWYAVNARSQDIYILEPGDGSYLGTADAVYRNIDFLERDDSELVLVLAGDHVYKMDYQKMLAYHRQTGADATVAVIPVLFSQAHRFGTVTIGGSVKITDFIEKPDVPRSNLVSMGIYVFNKRVLIERLIEDAVSPDSPHDFGRAIMPDMIKRDRVAAYRFNRYWRDIGNPEAYFESNMELRPQSPSFSLDGMWPVLVGPQQSSSPTISGQGRVRNSVVSPGCIIKGHVENSILSPGVLVDEKAVVRNSVIMADTSVGFNSVVDHCVLGEDVNVGRACYLGFGGTVTPGGSGVTLLGDGVTVPPYMTIGRNCRLNPNAGPEDFPEKMVPANTVISPLIDQKSWRYDGELFGHVDKSLSAP